MEGKQIFPANDLADLGNAVDFELGYDDRRRSYFDRHYSYDNPSQTKDTYFSAQFSIIANPNSYF